MQQDDRLARSTGSTRVTLVLWLGILFNPLVWAQDRSVDELLDLDFEELLEYEDVTPVETGIRFSESPGAVSVITYDQIRRSTARTIPELLRTVPGIHVRWNAMIQVVDIRGFGSNPFTNKVLLLIDGVPYNSWNKGGFPQHPGFDFFNLENVKHVEIIRGPGSALYGENALNGVINIVTLSGDELGHTRASATLGVDDRRHIGLTHGMSLGDDGSLLVSLRDWKSRLPTELWKDTVDATATGYDVFLKGKYGGWQASYYRSDGTYDGFDFNAGPLQFVTANEVGQTVNIAAIQFNHQSSDDRYTVQTNLSYADRDGAHCTACHAADQRPDVPHEEDHGNQWFGNIQLGVHHFDNHDLLLGLEFRRLDSGDHDQELLVDTRPGVQHRVVTSYDKGAVFLQDRLTAFDEQLEIVAGIRYDLATSPRLLNSEISPRLAAVYRISDRWKVNVGWSESTRYPSFTELYQDSWFSAARLPSGDPLVFALFDPNPDLIAESVRAIEAGLEYRPTPRLVLKTDFFLNRTEDPIIVAYQDGNPSGIRFENHPNEATTKGFEFDLRARPSKDLSLFLNWSLQINSQRGDGVDSSGAPIEFTYSPKHKVNLGATWSFAERASATIEASWRDSYSAPAFWYAVNANAAVPNPLPDYAYINVRFDYRLPLSFGTERYPLKVAAIVRNVGNQQRFETLTGFGGRFTGRQYFVNLEYEWDL